MKKMLIVVLVLLLTASVLVGCKSSVRPSAAAPKTPASSSANEQEAAGSVQTETEQATTVIPSDASDSDPILPEEMTMEEIEAELGFGYQLPDVSEHNGKIQCAADNGTLALGYTSDEFVGRVVIWKSVKTDQDVYASWDQWPESGQETVEGVQVRFRGNSPDYKGIAFWTQDGYQYVMNCETAPGSDIMSILPLFIEDKQN
ncbi:MAG: hypothetical protein IKQ04_06740 [Oscillospiraceae bacterium]|nr:hypothetical protein [Oscillospiraceae bacterium]